MTRIESHNGRLERELKVKLINQYQRSLSGAGGSWTEGYYELPFIEELHRGDSLLWNRFSSWPILKGADADDGEPPSSCTNPTLTSIPPALQSEEQEALRLYSAEIFRLYAALMGEVLSVGQQARVYERWSRSSIAGSFGTSTRVKDLITIHSEITDLLHFVEDYLDEKDYGIGADTSHSDLSVRGSGWSPSSGLAALNGMTVEARALCCLEVGSLLERVVASSGVGGREASVKAAEIIRVFKLDLLPINASIGSVQALAEQTEATTALSDRIDVESGVTTFNDAPALAIARDKVDVAYRMAILEPSEARDPVDKASRYLSDLGADAFEPGLRDRLNVAMALVDAHVGTSVSRLSALERLHWELSKALGVGAHGQSTSVEKELLTALQLLTPYARGVVAHFKATSDPLLLEALNKLQDKVLGRLVQVKLPSSAEEATDNDILLADWMSRVRETIEVRRAVRALTLGERQRQAGPTQEALISSGERTLLQGCVGHRSMPTIVTR